MECARAEKTRFYRRTLSHSENTYNKRLLSECIVCAPRFNKSWVFYLTHWAVHKKVRVAQFVYRLCADRSITVEQLKAVSCIGNNRESPRARSRSLFNPAISCVHTREKGYLLFNRQHGCLRISLISFISLFPLWIAFDTCAFTFMEIGISGWRMNWSSCNATMKAEYIRAL